MLDVEFAEFCRHLDELGHRQSLPPQLVALYLCTACSLGDSRACLLLDVHHFPALRSFLGRFDPRAEVIDELLQRIRYRLLVGPQPRIRSYRGEACLDGWLRKVATSVAIDAIRAELTTQRHRSQLDVKDATFEQCHGAPPLPPDEQLHRERYTQALQAALSQALRKLSREQRQLLYNYYVSELTIDQLGAMYGCHRSSAARRVGRCVALVQRMLRSEVARAVPGALELEGWGSVLYRRAELREIAGR
jgi:RNA polymerase sigma-70 factor (ECF subfamily)